MHTKNSFRSAPQMPISVEGAKLLPLVKVLLCQVRKGNSEYFGVDKINPNVLHQIDANGKYERIDVSEKIKITRRVTHYTGQQWAQYQQRQTQSHPKHYKKKYGVRHVVQLGNTPAKKRFISLKKVIDIVGFNKTFIYSRVDLNQFPQPVKLGNSRRAASRWVEEEVMAWVDNLISSRISTTLGN